MVDQKNKTQNQSQPISLFIKTSRPICIHTKIRTNTHRYVYHVQAWKTEGESEGKGEKGADHMYSAITFSVESERSRLRRSESSDIVEEKKTHTGQKT